MEKLEYIFDVQLLVEGNDVKLESIKAHLEKCKGDSLLVVGDDGFVKVHFHTNEPWDTLKYCAGCGVIHDIVVENMQKQQEDFLS